MTRRFEGLRAFDRAVVECRACDRLVRWREKVAREKRASFADWDYWGRPVPCFGPGTARLLVVGLAPAAHGANRTGRMFTGDRSGDWLFEAMHAVGFANQPESTGRGDGLRLKDARITAVVHCAPPDNKPTTKERDRCMEYLVEELRLLRRVRVIVALGGFAWNGALRALAAHGHALRPKPKFSHLAEVEIGKLTMIGSYHPSQQNTFTGRLTRPMLRAVFERARERIAQRT
jgi:uracil-DNA glycosylase family 4